MTRGRPRLGAKPMSDDRARRTARYAELRDQGMRPVDAARETGIGDSTGRHYERWYRKLRGLPPGPQRDWIWP